MEREQDIAALQADLGSVRSELEHWRSTAAKYEEEIGRLQEAFTQQQQHQNTATQLQGEPGPHSFLRLQNVPSSHGSYLTTHVSLAVECGELQQRCARLQQECDGLRSERTALSDKLQRLETELSR